jgi:hypothetical protein
MSIMRAHPQSAAKRKLTDRPCSLVESDAERHPFATRVRTLSAASSPPIRFEPTPGSHQARVYECLFRDPGEIIRSFLAVEECFVLSSSCFDAFQYHHSVALPHTPAGELEIYEDPCYKVQRVIGGHVRLPLSLAPYNTDSVNRIRCTVLQHRGFGAATTRFHTRVCHRPFAVIHRVPPRFHQEYHRIAVQLKTAHGEVYFQVTDTGKTTLSNISEYLQGHTDDNRCGPRLVCVYSENPEPIGTLRDRLIRTEGATPQYKRHPLVVAIFQHITPVHSRVSRASYTSYDSTVIVITGVFRDKRCSTIVSLTCRNCRRRWAHVGHYVDAIKDRFDGTGIACDCVTIIDALNRAETAGRSLEYADLRKIVFGSDWFPPTPSMPV